MAMTIPATTQMTISACIQIHVGDTATSARYSSRDRAVTVVTGSPNPPTLLGRSR
jgi:hypothetical protein